MIVGLKAKSIYKHIYDISSCGDTVNVVYIYNSKKAINNKRSSVKLMAELLLLLNKLFIDNYFD